MDISIFTDKTRIPINDDLTEPLGETFPLWLSLSKYVYEKYPTATEGWNYPGKKYGWSFRIKDKKRAIMYFLPREEYFMVAFVFGGKAMEEILSSDVSEDIKTMLKNARVYAEGRGIQIDVKDDTNIPDIKKLVEIKLAN